MSGKHPTRRRGSSVDQATQEELSDLSQVHVPDELRDFIRGIAIQQADLDDGDTKSPKKFGDLKKTQSKIDTNIKHHRAKPMRVKASLIMHDPHGHEGGGSDSSSDSEDSDVSNSDEEAKRRWHHKTLMRFTEYEIALLWTQFRDNFPSGKVNQIQLGQMLRQVFPKCEHEPLDEVVDKIMSIFDPAEIGTISLREPLITFALSMNAPLRDKLKWTFRLYDVEGNGEIYLDDLVQIVWKLCEFTKGAEVLLKEGQARKSREVTHPVSGAGTPTRGKKSPKELKDHQPAFFREDSIKLLSNKLGHRAESVKQTGRSHSGGSRRGSSKKKKNDPASSKSLVEAEDKTKTKSSPIQLDEEEKAMAKEAVKHLDKNGDGRITMEEFLEGCLQDEEFLHLMQCFNGEIIWGTLFQVSGLTLEA